MSQLCRILIPDPTAELQALKIILSPQYKNEKRMQKNETEKCHSVAGLVVPQCFLAFTLHGITLV